ncbi:MAG TPA: hypothetical protein VF303_01320 [Candidatus Nanoarchaeia archaeon]
MPLFIKKERKKSKYFRVLSTKLEKKKEEVLEELQEKHKEVARWAKKKGIKVEEIAHRGARGLTAGIATSAIVLSAGATQSGELPRKDLRNQKEIRRDVSDVGIRSGVKARKDVTGEVGETLQGVNPYNEKEISKRLSKVLKIPVKAELDGIRLNTTYGIMGYESHLSCYPGDNLSTHFHSDTEFRKFAGAGMAGGPGAWGYLAPNREALSTKEIEREKYYFVAQTFLSPNWGTPAVKNWFHHRKMVVVNPKNGVVVIGVLEDAGPEPWTGSSFGGSPEVVEELDLAHTGPHVLMYFVDDPKDQIPLGRYGI